MTAAADDAPTVRLEAEGRLAVYDARWQYPAITERRAWERMRGAARLIPPGCAYLGFPWASLIDLIDNRPAEAAPLISALGDLAARLAGKSRIVTTCQHIRLLHHQHLFYEAGVTDIFWSHAVRGEQSLPEQPATRLHPFPLYPVQSANEERGSRDILFSFVGARARDFYLTEARNHILDLLAADPRGYIRGRSDWHYNKIVYHHQILNREDAAEGLVDREAETEFSEILARSVFSLCPSGSGPNSIRLWESLGAGAIPVVLAETWAPPGDPALWAAAAVFCAETPEAIAVLPERLAALAADEGALAGKRRAMRQLWRLYGPDWFTHDIEKLFLSVAAANAKRPSAPLPLSPGALASIAVDAGGPDADFLLAACASRMLLDTAGFAGAWREAPALETACDAIAARHAGRPLARTYEAAKARMSARAGAGEASQAPLRVFSMGANAARMPLSYDAYGAFFQGEVEEAENVEDAEILVFAASPNVLDCADEILGLKKKNPSLKLAVMSEEPLWDTTWARDWGRRAGRLEGADHSAEYAILSHATCDIFAFEKLPYFVTTTDDFFVRYAALFRRNAQLRPQDVIDCWRGAPVRAAFFAEKRQGAPYDFQEPAQDLAGLCAYRTRLAEAMRGEGVLRVGLGWTAARARRQDLADWHLDKLDALDRKSFIVSGLENTHWPEYITEKPFDAFAVLGLPLYYASPAHRIREIVPGTAYLNLYGKTAEEAAAAIAAFEPDLPFAAAYLDAQKRLADLFADPQTLMKERARVARAVRRALARVRAEGRPA